MAKHKKKELKDQSVKELTAHVHVLDREIYELRNELATQRNWTGRFSLPLTTVTPQGRQLDWPNPRGYRPIQVGFAGQGGRGILKAGALEQSNVDVSTELTPMIESQTVYTANSKVFMTGNELLETLMNLKR